MEALTLDKAIELYEILGAHIPDVESEDIDATEFIGKIVHNIRESEQHKDYVGKPWEEMKELDPIDVLNLFTEGLSTNRIVNLKSFCKEIRFGDARS
ncbi:MAG: hypothetical protein ACXACT_17920 [Candidatus Thorarchaeota archaeon]|jgi:hypothetical protein